MSFLIVSCVSLKGETQGKYLTVSVPAVPEISLRERQHPRVPGLINTQAERIYSYDLLKQEQCQLVTGNHTVHPVLKNVYDGAGKLQLRRPFLTNFL